MSTTQPRQSRPQPRSSSPTTRTSGSSCNARTGTCQTTRWSCWPRGGRSPTRSARSSSGIILGSNLRGLPEEAIDYGADLVLSSTTPRSGHTTRSG